MKSVTVTYRTDDREPVTALDAVSISIRSGQVAGLFGPHGSGKTTVLRLLACLTAPDAGSVLLNGFDSVRDRAMAAKQVGGIIDGAHDVDLSLADAPILLVDEGACEQEKLAGRVAALCARARSSERRQTVVLATCEPGVVRALCDRVVVLDRGRRVADVALGHEADLSHDGYYRIEVKGRLDARRRSYFEGLCVAATENGTTTIDGLVADQAALHGLLARVRDLGLPLLSVNRCGPDLEGLLAQFARPV
jgi:ABC-type Na+ transport system ATPase subunit NatA